MDAGKRRETRVVPWLGSSDHVEGCVFGALAKQSIALKMRLVIVLFFSIAQFLGGMD